MHSIDGVAFCVDNGGRVDPAPTGAVQISLSCRGGHCAFENTRHSLRSCHPL